ncbi:MAG: bifunctional alpha,alpha-trehalose-phosphate synthase (UDP-forming)/trehalose-phosphatase [Bacteroidia bacterium]|nr:bifunctional alpha,alpha-trehalose-phosphate synthase (UDP-forming)/trehalose-phosphatase [Bacteroidia bacterium]
MDNSRLLIVAHRLPLQYNSASSSLQRSSGGLVSSMVSYLERRSNAPNSYTQKSIWVGAAELSEKKYKELPEKELTKDKYFDQHPIFLPEAIKSKFYLGFCNDCLWPLFHYFPSYAKYLPDQFSAYIKANELFMKKILEVYRPGDLIWIHDYHLMLLPHMLREALPNASIGFFLHIPFPSFEVFRIMPNPWKKRILTGILGADLIGFHTADYMQYFLRSIRQVLGYDINGRKIHCPDRVITVDAFPVSIDFNKFYHASDQPAIFEEKKLIRKKMSGRQLILSVDRLDYSKAIVNRLESFELFLERHKHFRGKVTYMLLVVPSREIITKYKENKQEIERIISSINGKYGTLDWVPVLYQYKSVDFTRLAGLYFAADVALITPLRDGMNLVAKEFVSTRIDKRGVLVLSETAGAAAELKEAIIVNPTDREEIAQAIYDALSMPVEEQMLRNESMQSRIRSYDVVKWAEDFIGQLVLQNSMQEVLRVKEITPLIENKIVNAYLTSEKRLLLLDYDGTLAPFAKTPKQATPTQKLRELLGKLCGDTQNAVVLVSGRKREDLEEWFGSLPLGLVAEHGGYFKRPGESWKQSTSVILDWKDRVRSVFESYQARCAGSFVEEKTLSLVWHYRNADKDLGAIRAHELLSELQSLSTEFVFDTIEGHMVIEARCRNINKGLGIKPWLESGKIDFILCCGDDRTDEDMFTHLPDMAYSIRLGLHPSHAKYNLRSQTDFFSFLVRLSLANNPEIETQVT